MAVKSAIQEFASLIAKREGKKSEESIGNVRETIKVISEEYAKDPEKIGAMLLKNGLASLKRAKAKVAKAAKAAKP